MTDRIYFVAPTRDAFGYRVVTVREHTHAALSRPHSWHGPYASEPDAQRVALTLHREADPHCTCNDCIEYVSAMGAPPLAPLTFDALLNFAEIVAAGNTTADNLAKMARVLLARAAVTG